MSQRPATPSRLRRAVIVTRKSQLTQLIERRGTFAQAEFYLRSRGGSIEPLVAAHDLFEQTLRDVHAALLPEQRRASLDRDDLERFLFAEDDMIVVVGQDGLVANVAKYLRGQPVVGINPDTASYDGVLCQHRAPSFPQVLRFLISGQGPFHIQHRAMAMATREDGQQLLALNEIFVGHRTHQSARYRLRMRDAIARHSSSGVICTTGTGATGWARSIAGQRQLESLLPLPTDPRLLWLAREPFPSVATTTDMDFGTINADAPLTIESDMSDNGVVFADGIESDFLEFVSGHRVEIGLAPSTLALIAMNAHHHANPSRSNAPSKSPTRPNSNPPQTPAPAPAPIQDHNAAFDR